MPSRPCISRASSRTCGCSSRAARQRGLRRRAASSTDQPCARRTSPSIRRSSAESSATRMRASWPIHPGCSAPGPQNFRAPGSRVRLAGGQWRSSAAAGGRDSSASEVIARWPRAASSRTSVASSSERA